MNSTCSVCDVIPKVDTHTHTHIIFHMGLGQAITLALAVLVAGVFLIKLGWAAVSDYRERKMRRERKLMQHGAGQSPWAREQR